ncbi:IQ and AAA domain-containing protein 1-like [Achroia grisella]|uniref:IQ and AAA domain-containing protein 1-like n=1 Tax=Achroia grisella TaxID=688607 RepID=UPI0027D279E8|nr:IQ and AAA domain-containing protein 1-like [Achroia grisella]
MPLLKIPTAITTSIEAHNKWLQIIKSAQILVEEDTDLQEMALKGLRLKERNLPPEVLGRMYAQYCDLINRLYDAYLNSVHLQRAPYILEIICVFMKRMYELRNELVYLITNDYIFVDTGLTQTRLTPTDIQIVVPYHIAFECRSESIEQVLQKMWKDTVKRQFKKVTTLKSSNTGMLNGSVQECMERITDEESSESEESISSSHTFIPQDFIQANIIQKHERFRRFFMADYRAKCTKSKIYFASKFTEASESMKTSAAILIQKVYRKYMQIKRQRVIDLKRDIILGIIPDPHVQRLKFKEENNKVYERCRKIRCKIKESYIRELENEMTKLIVFRKDNQIDDITDQVLEWFKEWYYGYGFFPSYPHELEGGTLLVIRGDYRTVEEQKEEDEKLLAATKGKTKEQLQQEKLQAEADAQMKAELLKEQKQKKAELLFKQRCNPYSDPGYQAQTSSVMNELIETLQKYRSAWSIYDRYPPDKCADVLYGYIKSLITEDLMCQIHKDCRLYVDELMRLDLKLLIKMHQVMYKRMGWKYPKLSMKKKPKPPAIPRPLNIDSNLLKNMEDIFDLGIITKPKIKIDDIYGDCSYAAYELNIRDPDAKFPPPGYGDIKRRLVLSCVFGSGIEPGAKRNKSVMLLGPERNGKSFLVDAVAGELNAVKIDITPEVFSAVVNKPTRMLSQVFLAARVFQPAVIYMRNVERVFQKKIPLQDKYLNVKSLKIALPKLLKSVSVDDKIIFIATCSNPFVARAKPMVSLFNEMILVPRTDYGSLQMFFYNKLQSIKSMDRDLCVQPIAQILQGYGFGVINEVYDSVMNPERIVRLNINPFSTTEILDCLIKMGAEPTTMEEYQEYIDFYLQNSPLRKVREEFETINEYRDVAYKKIAKKKAVNQ